MIHEIETLCKRDKKYIDILANILEVDEEYKDNEFGWTFADVKGWGGGHVATLLQEGIIEYGYKSSNEKNFKLVCSREELAQVLNEIEPHVKQPVTVEDVINPDLIQKFEDLVSSGTDMVEYWSKWVNPKVEGLEHIKKAILLCIASHGDKFGDRGRVHLLMHGDPGSAKSVLKDWVVYQLNAESCSQRTTKVGLTGSATGEMITPGALPRAHGKVLCIDELDKFSQSDRQGLLEAMEEGVVNIEAGGMSARLDAETRMVGCANRLDNFSPELLDRFDFKIHTKAPTGEQEKKVICSIIDTWFESKDGYDGIELKAYLDWVKSFEPVIPIDVRVKMKQLVSMYIDLDESIRGSTRRKESILRVTFTIAKLNKRDVVVDDILSAIKLLNPSLNGGKMLALEQLART